MKFADELASEMIQYSNCLEEERSDELESIEIPVLVRDIAAASSQDLSSIAQDKYITRHTKIFLTVRNQVHCI